MNKGKKIGLIAGLSVVAAVVVFAVVYTNKGQDLFMGAPHVVEEKKIPENSWKPYKLVLANELDSVVIRAAWDQKYGTTKVVYCRTVFHNEKENLFKLGAPWLGDVIIERSNMNNVRFDKVEFSSKIKEEIYK